MSKALVIVLLFGYLAVVHSAQSFAFSGGLQQSALVQHNTQRVVMGAPDIQWSASLASEAAAFAGQCTDGHASSRNNHGENLHWTTQLSDVDDLSGWIGEKKSWNCVSDSCSGVCGHYTQMIWAASTQLGCGYADCGPHNGFTHWYKTVCRYNPQGNFKSNGVGRAVPVSNCNGGGSSNVPVPRTTSPVPRATAPVPRATAPAPRATAPVPRATAPVPKTTAPTSGPFSQTVTTKTTPSGTVTTTVRKTPSGTVTTTRTTYSRGSSSSHREEDTTGSPENEGPNAVGLAVGVSFGVVVLLVIIVSIIVIVVRKRQGSVDTP